MKINCVQCQKEFERELAPELPALSIFKTCPQCMEENAAARRAVTLAEWESNGKYQWLQMCPPAFQLTDAGRLPLPSIAQSVLDWKYGPRGLILYGKTRTGKTRTAWLLIKKQFEAGRTARVMDSMSGFEYGSVFNAGGAAALEWVQDRSRCSLLFLDDVFKVKLTESFESAIFAIVDYRLNHCLPILATLNDTGDTLAARMTDDRGNPFIARLKEMCDTIIFK